LIQIPNKLKKGGIDFVLIEKSGKKPFQQGWQNRTIPYYSDELLDHIEKGGNYGVRGGGEKHLVIVDFDNEELQNAVLGKFPETFTVKTGGGLLHLYFWSDQSDSFKIFTEDRDTLADVQGTGKQVVGPSSIHPNGNSYSIVFNNDIAQISYAELRAILMPYDRAPKKARQEPKEVKKEGGDDLLLQEMKSKISIKAVLGKIGIDTEQNPTMCPFHSSKGGKCLGFNGEVAHCFHCDESWNIFSLVMDYKKVGFRGALEWLAAEFGMQRELDESTERYFQKQVSDKDNELANVKMEYFGALLADPKSKDWAAASEVLVKHIEDKNQIYTIKYDAKNEMWIYQEGIYVPNGRSEISAIVRDILGDQFSNHILGLVTLKIEADTYINADDFFNFNAGGEVPVINGLLNVRTRELSEFDSKKIFFSKFPVTYDPAAGCGKITEFLGDTLAKSEDVKLFYEMVGYALLNEYKFEKAFIFVGDGRNGKSKSIELIKKLIGAPSCCSLPLTSLVPESFSISELFGKRLNLAGDIGSKDLKDTSMFKALTGRDLISAKRKFLNELHFENTAKFIFACNELPRVYDTSKGFWDRWVLLEFPYTFVSVEEHSSAEDNSTMKIRDEDIIKKISDPMELSGFLNAALDGLDRLLEQRTFSSTLGAEEIKNRWVRKANSIMAFCFDKVVESAQDYMLKKDFRRQYSIYCKEHKVKVASDRAINEALTELFGAYSERRSPMPGMDQEHMWSGIKWKNAL